MKRKSVLVKAKVSTKSNDNEGHRLHHRMLLCYVGVG